MSEPTLEPLVTECPSCETRFRVSETQLEVAEGRVRCGACLTVFQATEHLLWESSENTPEDVQRTLDEVLSDLDAETDLAPNAASTADQEVEDADQEVEDADQEVEDADGPVDEIVLVALDTEEMPELDLVKRHGAEVERHGAEVTHQGAEVAADEPPEQTDDEGLDALAVDEEAELASLEKLDQIALGLPGREPEGVAEAEPIPTEDTLEIRSSDEVDLTDYPDIADAFGDLATTIGEVDEAEEVDEPAVEVDAREDHAEPGFDPVDRHMILEDVPERRRGWIGIGVVVAVVALGAQVLWYQFERWTRDPELRFIYEMVCDVAGCELPVMRSLPDIITTNLVVRTHPDIDGALIVDALILNEASFAQPFPVVELRFSRIDGQLAAARRFEPVEYLSGELRGATQMQVMTPVHIALEIEDPGPDAVNYVMLFR